MMPSAGRYWPALDQALREAITLAPQAPGFQRLLEYPMGWVDADGKATEESGGKRIRPLLLLSCAEAAGGSWQTALPAAAAVELLHNFSLIHDDIEDASPLRHGRMALWKQWGVASAINAGDAMFALSYAALTRLRGCVPDDLSLRALDIFCQANLDLTRGQHLDIRFETQPDVTADEYLTMIEGKTASLLAVSAELGALIGSGNDVIASHYRAFGFNLGMAFQIRDDILGIWGDPTLTGKSAATDILARKKSLPVLYGLERSPALRELYARESFGEAETREAVRLLDSLDARGHAASFERNYHQRALDALHAARPAEPAATELRGLLDALLGRIA
ncbi:MAG: polyprenyl synthetase family protein [Anaerolineae bacterium]|nr:polyprenyl synthetase family protein [Anaerolineae bacterium]